MTRIFSNFCVPVEICHGTFDKFGGEYCWGSVLSQVHGTALYNQAYQPDDPSGEALRWHEHWRSTGHDFVHSDCHGAPNDDGTAV